MLFLAWKILAHSAQVSTFYNLVLCPTCMYVYLSGTSTSTYVLYNNKVLSIIDTVASL